MKILIVEDSKVNQMIAKDTLVKNEIPCEIDYALDGEEALEKIFTQEIDLILLDIIMPKLTGLEVLERLHREALPNPPSIIMLTTIGDTQTLKSCFDLGAVDYIRKPFEELDFIARIRSALREVEQKAEIRRSAELLAEQIEQLNEANRHLQEAQYYMVQKEKLVAIGELAAGIAHEINNPLAFVVSNFSNIKQYGQEFGQFLEPFMHWMVHEENENMHDPCEVLDQMRATWHEKDMGFVIEDFPEVLEDSQKGLDRVAKIVTSMRNFARVSDADSHEYVDLNDLIEEVLMIVNNELKYSANVAKNMMPLPLIYCNKGEIEQVLVNLLVNASQAIKAKNSTMLGAIDIHTSESDGFVSVVVTDDGIGMEKEVINKIFDPFFTTKPVGQGTGLGLSISHSIIVEKHNGKILVESEKGIGTVFTIILPISRPATQ